MLDIASISANGGWLMAGSGIAIVFTGLILLSLLIATLPRVMKWMDDLRQMRSNIRESRNRDFGVVITDDIRDSVAVYRRLSDYLGEPFQVNTLADFARKRGLTYPEPATVLEACCRGNLIVQDEAGDCRWHPEVLRTVH